MISFVVPGVPVSWKRAKRSYGLSYTDPKESAHRDRIRMFARNAGIRRPLEGPVRLDVTFFTPHDPLDERTGDRDNYLKLVQDALEGFAFVNDRQVCDGTPRKVQDAANPRTEITISKAVL